MQNTIELSALGLEGAKKLHKILTAWINHGLPDDFEDEYIEFMFSDYTPDFFLVNDIGQSLAESHGKLLMFYSCRGCGLDGFEEDINWDKEKCLCGVCAQDNN